MFRCNRLVAVLVTLALLAMVAPAAAQGKYHLGHKATPAEIAGWNIDVRPDGTGLPDGQGSVDQGNEVYDAHCASCHGTFGESNEYLALTGIKEKLNYATTLFDYINRAMPYTRSKVLSADEVYAVTAYVLNLNDIVAADFVADKDTLPKVKMPNRDGLQPYPGLMSVHGKPDVHNTACMRDCEKKVEVTGSLPEGFVEKLYGDIRDNFRGLATMNEAAPPAVAAPVAAADGAELVQKFGCTVCHSTDKKIVGPAFREVADKYRGQADAVAFVSGKIRSGGSGVFGPIPMPPQPELSDADLATIAKWVLTLSTKK